MRENKTLSLIELQKSMKKKSKFCLLLGRSYWKLMDI